METKLRQSRAKNMMSVFEPISDRYHIIDRSGALIPLILQKKFLEKKIQQNQVKIWLKRKLSIMIRLTSSKTNYFCMKTINKKRAEKPNKLIFWSIYFKCEKNIPDKFS